MTRRSLSVAPATTPRRQKISSASPPPGCLRSTVYGINRTCFPSGRRCGLRSSRSAGRDARLPAPGRERPRAWRSAAACRVRYAQITYRNRYAEHARREAAGAVLAETGPLLERLHHHIQKLFEWPKIGFPDRSTQCCFDEMVARYVDGLTRRIASRRSAGVCCWCIRRLRHSDAQDHRLPDRRTRHELRYRPPGSRPHRKGGGMSE